MKLKGYCVKEGKEYLSDEWDSDKNLPSHTKQSSAEVTYLYDGNAKKVICGRRRCEAVQKKLTRCPECLETKSGTN